MNCAELTFSCLTTLEEAFELVDIRNECRHMMTNWQDEISREEQQKWFQEKYLKQSSPQSYQVWLLKDCNELILGYFAIKTEENKCFITEGIREEFRVKGLGSYMLNSFRNSELLLKKEVFADILNTNAASISLHRKFGFKKHSEINPETSRYLLIC